MPPAHAPQLLGSAGRRVVLWLVVCVLPVHLHPAKRARPVSCDHLQASSQTTAPRFRPALLKIRLEAVDLLALARSPEDLRLRLRAAEGALRSPGLIARDYGSAQFPKWSWTSLGGGAFSRSDTGRAEVEVRQDMQSKP